MASLPPLPPDMLRPASSWQESDYRSRVALRRLIDLETQVAAQALYSLVYVDETARLAAGPFTSADVGRVAWQQSDDTFWLLDDNSPITWTEVSGATAIPRHAVTHLPGGIDGLATGVPVAIGVTNQEGSAASFSRSDHVHALPALDPSPAGTWGSVTVDSRGIVTGGSNPAEVSDLQDAYDNWDGEGSSITVLATRGLTVTQAAYSDTGAPTPILTLTGGVHAAVPADTEVHDVHWNLARALTFEAPTGILMRQRAVRIDSPTYQADPGPMGVGIAYPTTFWVGGPPTMADATTGALSVGAWVEMTGLGPGSLLGSCLGLAVTAYKQNTVRAGLLYLSQAPQRDYFDAPIWAVHSGNFASAYIEYISTVDAPEGTCHGLEVYRASSNNEDHHALHVESGGYGSAAFFSGQDFTRAVVEVWGFDESTVAALSVAASFNNIDYTPHIRPMLRLFNSATCDSYWIRADSPALEFVGAYYTGDFTTTRVHFYERIRAAQNNTYLQWFCRSSIGDVEGSDVELMRLNYHNSDGWHDGLLEVLYDLSVSGSTTLGDNYTDTVTATARVQGYLTWTADGGWITVGQRDFNQSPAGGFTLSAATGATGSGQNGITGGTTTIRGGTGGNATMGFAVGAGGDAILTGADAGTVGGGNTGAVGGSARVRAGAGTGGFAYGNVTLADTGGYVGVGLISAPSDLLSLKKHAAFSGSESNTATAALQTTDAAETSLWTLTLSDAKAYWLEATLVGRDASGAACVTATVKVRAWREGGGAEVGDDFLEWKDPAGHPWLVKWDIDGNDVRLRVTGALATTINWTATINYQGVSGSA